MSGIEIGDTWKTKVNDVICVITEIKDTDGCINIASYSAIDGVTDSCSLDDFMRDYVFVSKKAHGNKYFAPTVNSGWVAGLAAKNYTQGQKDDSAQPKAVQILNEAVAIMAERGKSYDKSGGQAERSMPKIVAMFNALTGHELTAPQGWKFMACLKLARSEQGEHREDNYLDGAAYFALAGEEASEAANDH